jgi:hypothetical protein
VLDLMLERTATVAEDAHTVCAETPAAERALADGHSIPQLNRLYARRAPAPDDRVRRFVPWPLLVGYGQIAEDLRFLRRFAAFDRARLVPALERRPDHRWDVTLSHRAVAVPDLTCRLSRRRIVDYHQAYRTLWPRQYAAHSAGPTGPEAAPAQTVWQSRITLSPSGVRPG